MRVSHRGMSCDPYVPQRRLETIERPERFQTVPDHKEIKSPVPDLSVEKLKSMLGFCGVDCKNEKKRDRNFIILILILIYLIFFH